MAEVVGLKQLLNGLKVKKKNNNWKPKAKSRLTAEKWAKNNGQIVSELAKRRRVKIVS